MPVIIQAFFTALAALLPSLVMQVLVSIGFGVATFSLASFTIDSVFSSMSGTVGQLPTEILAVLNYANFDQAVSIVFGTYAAVFAFLGVRGGKISKLGFKGLPS